MSEKENQGDDYADDGQQRDSSRGLPLALFPLDGLAAARTTAGLSNEGIVFAVNVTARLAGVRYHRGESISWLSRQQP